MKTWVLWTHGEYEMGRSDIRGNMLIYLAALLVAVMLTLGIYAFFVHPGQTTPGETPVPTESRQ